MKKILITSTRTSAGKTLFGAGLVQHLGNRDRTTYFKPFADRLIHGDKKVTECDSRLFAGLLPKAAGISDDLFLGYDYDVMVRESTREEISNLLHQRMDIVSRDADLVIVESARNFSYGSFGGFDSMSLCMEFDMTMILVADGDPGLVVDKCIIVNDRIASTKTELSGVVINKVQEHYMEEMKTIAVPALERRGITVLGLIPEDRKLSTYSVGFLARKIGAKVLAGHDGLNRNVERTLVGAMTAETAMQKHELYEPNSLIITGGDRVDMILLAMETNSAGVLLTGNLVPHPRILAKADDLEIPLLTTSLDTYRAARQVEQVEALILEDDEIKIKRAGLLVKENIKLELLEKYI